LIRTCIRLAVRHAFTVATACVRPSLRCAFPRRYAVRTPVITLRVPPSLRRAYTRRVHAADARRTHGVHTAYTRAALRHTGGPPPPLLHPPTCLFSPSSNILSVIMTVHIPQSICRHPVLASFIWGVVCAAGIMIGVSLTDVAGPLDPDSYGLIARQVYEGHGFSYASPSGLIPAYERGPVFPLAIAVVMWLTGGFALGKLLIINAILHGACTALTQRLGARVMPVPYSLVAALVVGIHPLLLWYALRVWSEPLLAFLVLWSIDALLRLDDNNNARTAVEAGAAFALAALTKSVVLFLPFVLVLLSPLLGLRLQTRFRLVILFVTVASVGTWMIHSYRERGVVSVVHTGLGFNLIQGNQLSQSFPRLPLCSLKAWEKGRDHANSSLADPEANVFEPGNDLLLVRAALRERMEAPAMGLGSIVSNAMTFWYLAETPAKSILAGSIQLPVLVLGLFFARRLCALHKMHRVAMLVVLYVWVVHALVFAWVRHSAPIVPLLVLVAISGLTNSVRKGNGRRFTLQS
jgi:4-amino-4-deoxy-L-arabinose transferase-like glycosyltransferase